MTTPLNEPARETAENDPRFLRAKKFLRNRRPLEEDASNERITDMLHQFAACEVEAALQQALTAHTAESHDETFYREAANAQRERAEVAEASLLLLQQEKPMTTDMICEVHPELEWPHGECAGPGVPKAAQVNALVYQRDQLQQEKDRERENTSNMFKQMIEQGLRADAVESRLTQLTPYLKTAIKRMEAHKETALTHYARTVYADVMRELENLADLLPSLGGQP